MIFWLRYDSCASAREGFCFGRFFVLFGGYLVGLLFGSDGFLLLFMQVVITNDILIECSECFLDGWFRAVQPLSSRSSTQCYNRS
jgi:hypothetical protein